MPSNQTNINIGVKYNVDQASVSAVKKSLQDLQNIKVKDFSGTKTQLDQIKTTARQVQEALDAAFNVNLNSLNVSTFNQQLKTAGLTVDQIYQSFSGAGAQGQVAFSKMASSVLTTNLQLKQTKSLITAMGETMANTVKWGIASSVMNSFTNSVQQAFQYAKSLDGALTDIRIVTGDSTEQMRQFAQQANNAAQNLGRSTMDYTKAALTFYQQGLSDEQVQTRTETILKAQNITGAGQEMADYLTAVWNGYKVANQEAELYVDKLAAVADSSASNMSQLAVAMSKVASSANALGVPVDNLNAQIATIVATTRQAPESVGNALKTIYSRINDITTGADDAEVSLGNYSKQMASIGFSVLDANGNLRDTGDVLDEIGGKWQTLSREQQIYLARTMAGQRQYNNLIALFDNWSKYTDLVNVSLDAQGTTMQKNARYMDSLEAKMEQFGAAGERVKDALIDEESLKGLVSIGTTLVNLVGNFVEAIGGGGNALLLLGSSLTTLFSGVISKEINNIVTNMQNVKNNALKIKQDIQNTKLFGQSQGYKDGAITAMVDAKKAAQQYYSFMTDAQKNEYSSIVEQIGVQQDKLTILNEQIQAANNFEKALKGGLQTAVDEKDALQEMLSSFSGKGGLGQLRNSDKFNALKTQIEDLSKIVDTSAVPAFDQFKKAIASIKDPAQATDQELRAVRIAAEQIASQTNTGINLVLSLDQTQAKAKEAASALELAKRASEEYLQNIKQFANINGIVQSTAAVGRLASALNSLANLKNIWSDQSLSTGQKFLQTIMSIGIAIPNLISTFSQLKTVTTAWSAALDLNGKIQTANLALTKTKTAVETAQIALKKSQTAVEAAHTKVLSFQTTVNETKAKVDAGQIGLTGALTAYTKALTIAKSAETRATQAEILAEQELVAAKRAEAAAQEQVNTAMAANPIGIVIAIAAATIYATIKAYDYFTMSVKQAEQAIEKFNEKQEELNNNLQKYNNNKDTLISARLGEWDKLAKKAGAYNSTINNLTEEEKNRYYELSNLIAQYNSAAVLGYDQQGNAIVDVNTNLEQTIRLLKEKRQVEIQSTYNGQEGQEARRGYQVQYQSQRQIARSEQAKTQSDLSRVFEDNLNSLRETLSSKGPQYIKYIEELNNIQEQGVQAYIKNSSNLDNLLINLKSIGITLSESSQQDLQALKNYNSKVEEENKKLAEDSKAHLDHVLGLLQANNQEYVKAKDAGSKSMDGLINSYIEGLVESGQASRENLQGFEDFETLIVEKYLSGPNGFITKINQALYTDSSKYQVEGKSSSLEQYLLNAVGQINEQTYSTLAQKQTAIFEKLKTVLLNNEELAQMLKDDSIREAIKTLIQNTFGIEIDLSKIAENDNFTITNPNSQKIRERITQEISESTHQWVNIPLDELEMELPVNLSASETDLLIEKFTDLYHATDDWKEVLEQAKRSVASMGNIDIFGGLNQLASGEIKKGSSQYQELQNQLNSLKDTYPQISNAVQILQTDWMQSTMTYQDALHDVNNLLLETMQNSIKSGDLTQEQVSTSLQNLITDSETLQNALGKQLITIEDYQNTLGNLASQYESCQTELNNYVHALQNGDEQTLANATATLELSLRSAELAQATGLSANQIESVAAQLSRGNSVLQENSELAADAAVRYIKLNTAIEDLYTNADDYLKVLERYGQGDLAAIDDWQALKDTIADVFDTTADALSDDFVSKHLQEIIEMADKGGEGLKELQELAAQDILVNTGIDLSQFNGDQELFLAEIADLEQGADINTQAHLDLLAFTQQLVTAMEQAGYAQEEIQARLSGIGLDVDLAPYEAGLNAAIEQAQQAGYLASDHFAQAAGVDAKMVSQTQEVPQQTVVPGQDYDVDYVRGNYTYPIISQTQGDFGPHISVMPGVFTTAVPVYRPKTLTEVVEGSVQSAATALEVIGAHKSSGGKISSYNKPAARAGRTPSKGGGKKGGGGGSKGSTKKPTVIKPQQLSEAKSSITDRSDVYHDVNLALKEQEDKLDDIENKQKKLVNRDRLENLQEQNKELEKQKDLLDQKSGIAASELVRLRNELIGDLGNSIQFDPDGAIANYNAALDKARDNYNDSIADYNRKVADAEKAYNNYVANYNSMSAQAQEKNKTQLDRQKDLMDQIKKQAQRALDVEKEKYDAIKSNVKEYQDTLDLQKDIADQQQEIIQKMYENLIAMSKIKVDLSLDTGEFERDWLEFENKFIKKLSDDDFLGSAKANVKELMSYFNSDQVQQTAKQIEKIRDEIAIMQRGGTSAIYGDNLAQAKEDLEQYMKQQMEDLENIQDLVDDIKDNYLDALDDAKQKMDDQIDQYERVNDLIEHNVKLVDLLYGDKAYDTMNKYYDLQKANNERELQSLKMQQDYWQNLMNNETVGSEAWKEMKKNLDDVTDNLNSKLEDMIQNLSDQWQNRIDGIIAKLNNALSGGRGLDYLDQQWDYINNFDDNFLDTFESRMGIQEVTDLYKQAIDGLSGSPSNQQKINKLMNDQLKILREKDNLTQYDIDRAKAALEVEKAKMALEEARYNKTKMRLRRDSQGNYTYQYVADEQKLSELQSALADAQANLYNMDKEHYTENLNNLYDAYKDYLDKMRDLTEEYNNTQDEEERARIQSRIDLLKESANDLMGGLTEDNRYALQYLNNSFFGGMGIDTALMSADQQMELMMQNIPQVNSNIQDLANNIVGQGGLLNATHNALDQINKATVEYDQNIKQFLNDAGTSLETISEVTSAADTALDNNIINAQNLITTNDELIKSCEAQIAAIQELMSWLDQYMNKVMNVETLVANLRSAYNTGQQLNGSDLTADNINVTGMNLDTTAGNNFTGNPAVDAAAVKQQIDALMAEYEKFLAQMAIATFDTGGSTGSWGDASGRLAFLHEKELVLNQEDTLNILRAVQTVRAITSAFGSVADSGLSALANGANGFLAGINNTEQLDQNVHIEANFPNVTQHTEIEQAFENLVNMASMKASKYRD